MGCVVGIDLGTTYSAVAIVRDDGLPEIINNAEGEAITPSVVLFQSFDGVDEPLVGTMAKHSAATDPDNVVQFVKRNMGDPHWRFDSDVATYTAEEVSAIILKKLIQDAQRELDEPIEGAVITVPAYFDDARRVATKDAGRIAGINVLRVLNEPTAAAISFGLDTEKDGTVLVYDLGGGTFDVTLLRIEGNDFKVIATDGDRNLGGFNFDNALMKFVAKELEKQGVRGVLDDRMLSAELREKCELAKKSLSNVEKTNIHISANGKPYRVAVTRADFEHESAELLRRTQEILEDVLDAADFTWDMVDFIILVGGSTRMPMVRRLITDLSGREPETDVNPDEAVALGAAVQASLERFNSPHSGYSSNPVMEPALSITVSDVTSQALGTLCVDRRTRRKYNSIIIPRNSPIPGSYSEVYETVVDNQREVEVEVTQGDSSNPDYVTLVGSSLVSLPPGLPGGSRFQIIFTYDAEQTVHVECRNPDTGMLFGTFSIERVANLDDKSLARAISKISHITLE